MQGASQDNDDFGNILTLMMQFSGKGQLYQFPREEPVTITFHTNEWAASLHNHHQHHHHRHHHQHHHHQKHFYHYSLQYWCWLRLNVSFLYFQVWFGKGVQRSLLQSWSRQTPLQCPHHPSEPKFELLANIRISIPTVCTLCRVDPPLPNQNVNL